MRRTIEIVSEGTRLAATLDEGASPAGLLIVSGGNEIRCGAHRGMAMLAAEIAAQGHPVLRFDRQGIGDSEGENGGFESSGADIAAAVVAFRTQCRGIRKVVAFGNCDAASALLLHKVVGIDALVLGNIWVVEQDEADSTPPAAAIKARYLERLRDPKAWIGLFTGAIDLKKLAKGLLKLSRPAAPSSLAQRVAEGIADFAGQVTILLAERDGTAIAFADAWKQDDFSAARSRPDLELIRLDSASHSFAGDSDHAALIAALRKALA